MVGIYPYPSHRHADTHFFPLLGPGYNPSIEGTIVHLLLQDPPYAATGSDRVVVSTSWRREIQPAGLVVKAQIREAVVGGAQAIRFIRTSKKLAAFR